MTLKRAQVLLRLPKPLKVAAEAAATELGLSLTDWLIAAINAQLGEVDSLADSKVEGENVWDAIGDLRDRLASVEARLRSHPPQPAPKPRGWLTDAERAELAEQAAKPPAAKSAAPTEPAAPTTEPAPTTAKGLNQEDALTAAKCPGNPKQPSRWLPKGMASATDWLHSQGWRSEGTGNKRKWYPPGGEDNGGCVN